MNRIALAALAPMLVISCAREGDSPSGPGLAISVAPLTLPGVEDACYTLAVYNEPSAGIGPSALVWSEASVCAGRFGDGRGSISYVGTCDASPDERTNTVSLVLEGLCQADGCDPSDDLDPDTIASTTFVNPCPATRPCLLERPCRENEDTSVVFDLTIMRRANQGFFDIAVNFEDVFCSAKLDCVPELLHRPAGARDLTAVLAFACTSGTDDTCLYATHVTLDCGGGNVWQIDPTAGPGNIAESSPLLFAAATYQGDEAFSAFEKSYWTIALGLDEDAFDDYPNCTLRWTTTASEDPLDGAGPYTTPSETTWPELTWERDIIVGGALACSAHALDETLPGETEPSVATAYTQTESPATFAFTNCAPGEPGCTCPEEFTPIADESICRRVLSVPALPPAATLDVCAGSNLPGSYTTNGARFSTSSNPADFEIPESGNPAGSCTDPALCVSETGWNGYLNDVGVWACPPGNSNRGPYQTWIGFSQCVALPAAGDYLVGIAGDNEVRLSVDGDPVYQSVSSLNFRAWNVVRVTLTAGTHLIEMAGLNHDAQAAFGAEIYGPFAPGAVATPALMRDALNPPIAPGLIVFSTRDLRPGGDGMPIAQFQTSSDGSSGYTCDAGLALDLCGSTASCTDIDEVACGSTGGGGGPTVACDAPASAGFADTFTRPDGGIGGSYLDLPAHGLAFPEPLIASRQACSSELSVAAVRVAPPGSGGLMHAELDVSFGHDQQRHAEVLAFDLCPTVPAIVAAGIDGSDPLGPKLKISAPLANQSVLDSAVLPLQVGVTYRLLADFFPDGTVSVVVRQGQVQLGAFFANVVTAGLLPTVPTYRNVGFSVGRVAGVAPACADNLVIRRY